MRKVVPAEMRLMWEAGARVKDIARHFGCHPTRVESARRHLGLPPRKAMKREDLEPLWSAGVPVLEIAHVLGVSESGVWKARARFGLPARDKGPQPRPRPVPQRVRPEDMLTGKTRAQYIALVEELGLSPSEALRRLYAAVPA